MEKIYENEEVLAGNNTRYGVIRIYKTQDVVRVVICFPYIDD